MQNSSTLGAVNPEPPAPPPPQHFAIKSISGFIILLCIGLDFKKKLGVIQIIPPGPTQKNAQFIPPTFLDRWGAKATPLPAYPPPSPSILE